jgi:hypothetical protein
MTALIAVYRDLETAEAVAAELRDDEAVPDSTVRVADWADLHASMRAEMQAEIQNSWGGVAVGGFVTGEMVRGALIFGALISVIGVLIGLPVGYFLYSSDASTWTRLAIGGGIGALFGATVGTLVGGGMAMKSPEDLLAAERGYPVTVEDSGDDPARAPSPVIAEAEAVMARHEPIRIDKLVNGQLVATPVTESPGAVQETVGEFIENTREPSRR